MMDTHISLAQWLFLAIVFAVVAGLALLALLLLSSTPLRQRLAGTQAGATQAVSHPTAQANSHTTSQATSREDGWVERAARVAQPFVRLSLPEAGWQQSPLRTRFMNAGWRNSAAPAVYFGAKTVLALGLPALLAMLCAAVPGQLAPQPLLLLLLGGAAAGYYLPNLLLARMAERRRREIFESFPDALDLLTVCVEAGLSLERALAKVAGEIHLKSVTLAQELQLVLMEMRSGFSKERALRNLALRSGVEDVDTLVAMLIQAERFGTSMGDSLRVHSDNLRGKRQMLAEEAAAKIGLKLLFPLIFCIFPGLMLVLLGPAALQISHVLMPALRGGA